MPSATPPPAIVHAMPRPAPGRHVVVAIPEHPRDAVRVGDVYVVPLFDGKISFVAAPLRDAGTVRIAYHSFQIAEKVWVGSNRGEAFLVKGTGNGTVLVLLVAKQLGQPCVSCRTVHYFLRAAP